MSDTPSPSHQKSRSAVALTSLLVVFAIAVLINILIGAFGWRFDLTEYKTYTLSEGTKNILQELESEIAALKTSVSKSNVGIVREIGDGVAKDEGFREVMLKEMI